MKVLISSVGVLAFRLHKEPTQEFKKFTFFGFVQGTRFITFRVTRAKMTGGQIHPGGSPLLQGHATIVWVWRALCLAALNRVDSLSQT